MYKASTLPIVLSISSVPSQDFNEREVQLCRGAMSVGYFQGQKDLQESDWEVGIDYVAQVCLKAETG